MRRCCLVLFVLGLLALASPDPAARAQPVGPETIYSKHRQFYIPFQIGPGRQRLKELKLWVSADQGKSWQQTAVAGPDQTQFQYISDRDGQLWFAVQTVDLDNRPFPASMEAVVPNLRVIVDTQPPVVKLRQLAAREGVVGVAWTIQDDHYDGVGKDAFRLEYRPVGTVGWIPLKLNSPANQAFWNVEGNGHLEVRLRVEDRAGNAAQDTLKVIPGEGTPGGVVQNNPLEKDPPVQGGGPVDPNRKLINSTSISLNFEIQDKGRSGISSIELWFTQDGRSWNKYPLPKPPEGLEIQSPLTFKVNNEGLYGFTLVAKSGVGLGLRPPQVGDAPQVWVEVDLTRPVVQLQHVHVGQGTDKGKLFISWKAYDKNLGGTPIGLSYAEKQDGPWLPIVETKLANTGKYVWVMPQGEPPLGVPYQFYVRVEAVDLAGNVGESVTQQMVRVDLSLPKVRILNVEPGAR